MEPALVVDHLDEVGKVLGDVLESFECHRVDRLDLQRFHEAFSLGIIVRIAAATHRTDQAVGGQCVAVELGSVLRAAVGMMNQPATFDGPPIMECLVERIEDESRVRRSTGPPANDTAGEGIDYKGHVDEALPAGDIGEIG